MRLYAPIDPAEGFPSYEEPIDPATASLYDSEPAEGGITLEEWESREEAHETTVEDLGQVEDKAMRRAA